jgi:hypothetical protein
MTCAVDGHAEWNLALGVGVSPSARNIAVETVLSAVSETRSPVAHRFAR